MQDSYLYATCLIGQKKSEFQRELRLIIKTDSILLIQLIYSVHYTLELNLHDCNCSQNTKCTYHAQSFNATLSSYPETSFTIIKMALKRIRGSLKN